MTHRALKAPMRRFNYFETEEALKMTDLSDLSRSDVFEMYETQVLLIAEEIAEDLADNGRHESLDGRKWCEENDVPEHAFCDAVEWHLVNADYGVSPLFPFPTSDDEEVTTARDVEDVEPESFEEEAEEPEEDEESDGEEDDE